MNFKRKAGAAVLAIAAASAIAVPGVAMADVATPSVSVMASDGVAANAGEYDEATKTLAIVSTATEDDVQAALDEYTTELTSVTMKDDVANYDVENIDFTDNSKLVKIELDMPNLVSVDGLDKVGGAVTITSSDLESIDFGGNEDITSVTLDTDLESISFSGMKSMISLDLANCSDLESIDLTDCDALTTITVTNTKLAAFDTTDADVSNAAVDPATVATGVEIINANTDGAVEIDSQYATKTVNSDDDDYDDYAFDLDSITNGMGEFVTDGNFVVTFADDVTANGPEENSDFNVDNDDDIDFKDGVLTISSDAAPKTITYTVDTNSKSSIASEYTVTFNVDTEGDRISGSDRYDTMVQINTDSDDSDFDGEFAKNAGNIVVASGAGYADALSASALAGALNTGIVTTPVDSMTDDTIDMLDDMDKQETAYIVGGTSAVSYAVEQQLSDLGFSIKRMAGVDRFDTAVKTQDKIQDLMDVTDTPLTNSKTVIIASGVNYADALAIAPYAYTQNMPIVLVGADGQMDDDSADLFNKYKKDYSNAIVVGGTAVVSDDVIDTLQGYDMDVIRLAGADRFETNLVINEWLERGTSSINSSNEIFAAAGYSKDDISDFNDEDITAGSEVNNFDNGAYVVTGLGFADALAVAPLAGQKNAVVTMVSDADITTVTEAKDNNADTTIIGGTAVISEDLADTIDDL